MATLRNKRKLAAVSRETPEGNRSSRTQNVLDPELAQDYISQVSEEIEGRVTKNLSKEFSKTESRILGALSKLDELLLNTQVRTCSVAVPGTSTNSNTENQETTGDRSSDDPCPEMGYFSHHSGQLNYPETENRPHSTKHILTCQLRLKLLKDIWNHDKHFKENCTHCQSRFWSKNSKWGKYLSQYLFEKLIWQSCFLKLRH